MNANDETSQRLFRSTNLLAREVAHELKRQEVRVVFAESCTAGLASAVLAQTAGISKWLCGSAVTYQESVKQEWLQIDPVLIQHHTAVSPEVTRQMATAVLNNTTAADFSVAVTGHLEPDASARGTEAFVAIAYHKEGEILDARTVCYPLNADARVDRQWEAARAVMNSTMDFLRYPPAEDPDQVDWLKDCHKPVNFHWNHWF